MKKGGLFSSGTTAGNVDFAALLLRLAGGGFMVYSHGAAKFSDFFSDKPIEFIDPFGIGATATLGLVIFSEAVCAVLVMLGLVTRYALIPLMVNMVYAAFFVHSADPFGKKELALIYLMIFLGLMLLGPGRYSLDRLIQKRRRTV